MSLTNAPGEITQFSTQLAACASWAALSGESTWYPTAPKATTLPFAVLASAITRTRYAVGAKGLPSGSLTAVIHVDAAAYTTGQLETLGRAVIDEMTEQDGGIFFRDADAPLASDPQPSEVAGGHNERTLTLTFNVGLRA